VAEKTGYAAPQRLIVRTARWRCAYRAYRIP